MSSSTRSRVSVKLLAAGLALAGVACVSPDVFIRDAGDQPGGEGGASGPGAGGGPPNGSGGSNGGAGSSGAGGRMTTGAGGTVVTGSGGRTGSGGATVVGPAANFMDNFENNDVKAHWAAPQSNDTPPCGTWAVVPESTGSTNHVYSQTSTACTSTSSPSWAAGGNVNWTDMRLQVRVRFDNPSTTTTRLTIAVRYNDSKDNYFIEYTNDGKMKIRVRNPSGTSDVMSLPSKSAVPVPNGTWSTIGLSIKGSTINAYIGTDPTAPPAVFGTASGLDAGGIAIGVADGTASFDDVLVTPP